MEGSNRLAGGACGGMPSSGHVSGLTSPSFDSEKYYFHLYKREILS